MQLDVLGYCFVLTCANVTHNHVNSLLTLRLHVTMEQSIALIWIEKNNGNEGRVIWNPKQYWCAFIFRYLIFCATPFSKLYLSCLHLLFLCCLHMAHCYIFLIFKLQFRFTVHFFSLRWCFSHSAIPVLFYYGQRDFILFYCEELLVM